MAFSSAPPLPHNCACRVDCGPCELSESAFVFELSAFPCLLCSPLCATAMLQVGWTPRSCRLPRELREPIVLPRPGAPIRVGAPTAALPLCHCAGEKRPLAVMRVASRECKLTHSLQYWSHDVFSGPRSKNFQVNRQIQWKSEYWTAPVHQFFGTWERRRALSKVRAGARDCCCGIRHRCCSSCEAAAAESEDFATPARHRPTRPYTARRTRPQIAKRVVREFFPAAHIVDYEGITAALPSDYTIDGEHFYCRYDLWKDRVSYPFPCKGLANAVASNLIANAACNDVTAGPTG